jgi:glutamate formiminotransferase/formiminotetrahydrofolate cyclodeaminase
MLHRCKITRFNIPVKEEFMQQIIECVPNFSDGRNLNVINAIADAIRGVPGTHVLDVSSDPDHNRTVITFVGGPTAVEEGAFQAIQEAAKHINLDHHVGEHPRIGATDVCPFIPVKGVTEADCVEIAERLGQRVGEELGIAVYLYGAAATSPEREKLSNIRRGQYEKWRDEVAANPARKPDFGPAEPKTWGATVIGVRPFLIAYNLYLNSDNVDIANKIARTVRFTSGGLRFVQAMGFLVEGQAQVSMNLTNYEKTAVHVVQELVRREAARYGLSITKAELIGMAPEKALLEAAQWYLQIDDLQDDQILELRLAEESEKDFTPTKFIDATAANTPTPGGGSTAALAGALSAALAGMVANLTACRKKYAEVEDQVQGILARVGPLQQSLTAAIAEDSAAFNKLMAVWRDKSLEGEAKDQAVEASTRYAGEVPLRVARLSLEAARQAAAIAEIGNTNAVTDAAAGVIMARAAVQIAAMNVKINAVGLKDQQLAQTWADELAQLESEVTEIAERTAATAAQRGGF